MQSGSCFIVRVRWSHSWPAEKATLGDYGRLESRRHETDILGTVGTHHHLPSLHHASVVGSR